MTNLVLQNDNLLNNKLTYWNNKLKGIAFLQLPFAYKNTSNLSANYDFIDFLLDKEIINKIGLLFADKNIDLSDILLTTLHILLYRHCNNEDISLGVICADENKTNYDKSNLNNNLLLLRNEFNGFTDSLKLILQVKQSLNDAKENNLPIGTVINCINSVNTTIDFKQYIKVVYQFSIINNSAIENNANYNETPITDINFSFTKHPDELKGKIVYNTDLHNKKTILNIVEHFKQILSSLINNPSLTIGALPLITTEEKKELTITFNNTKTDYPKQNTIVDLFEQQVLKTPSNIALKHDDGEISYHKLNELSNKLAHYLINSGVTPNDNIGLIADRSFDMIIGMYAILKAGCAYVPIDPEYPQDRQEYILRNSFVKLVITDAHYLICNHATDLQFINMNSISSESLSNTNPCLKINSNQLAYTIYTSGSTGRPKGVMIEHHSAVNLISWVNNTFNIGSTDRLLFITSMCFDLSVYDIFGMLSTGGSIFIANRQEVMDVKKLPELLLQHNITFWDSVPTTLDYLVRGLESKKETYVQDTLRLVFLSGDWIPVNLPDRIKKFFPSAKVISLGGATEGTVWSNYFPVNEVDRNWKSIPYGKPIDNNTFYILNEQLQPVPIGIAGELFIGGVGVARGYANDNEKTNYSFIEDPFNAHLGARMYRTGDLGRMLPNMNMEFIGRKDNQVKIRGFRVELGEIESVVLQSGLVNQAVVIAAKDKDNNNRLICYVVPNRIFDRDVIIADLRSKLPDYMVPALWVELKALPLTANGKIDKKALPEVDTTDQLKNNFVSPTTETEIKLAAIWQDVLGIKSIGIDDNFFDLGGQSLLAVQLTSDIEEKLGAKFNIYTLFKYPTIRELASFLEKGSKGKKEKVYKSLVPIKTTGKKMPIYVVHGDGMNVANFSNLGAYLDSEQPIYSLQPLGLNKEDEPLDDLVAIAKQYVAEILEQNPIGPYALAGYSFGGYVAVEMRNQLVAMGKTVKMLAIFDTDAQNAEYNKSWIVKLPKRIKRQLPKLLFVLDSLFKRPLDTHKYQVLVIKRKIDYLSIKFGLKSMPVLQGFDTRLSLINEKHLKAFKDYNLSQFDDKVVLFKAKTRIYFVDDFKFLGWKKYALKGVSVYDVPGDHKTMFLPPNVIEFARLLQIALDNC